MIKFFYRVKREGGEEETGERLSTDRFTLARELRGEGLTVISVNEVRVKIGNDILSKVNIFGHRVKLKDKIIFASNLSSMLSAGLSLSRALSVLSKQTNNKNFKRIIDQVGEKINKGDSFSRALASYPKVFPEVFVAMIEAAEESGKMPEALKLIAEQLEKSYGLRRKIVGALIYPAVIVAVIFAIGILMMIFLIPTLSATFKELGVPLPMTTLFVIGLSDFLVNNLILVLILIAGAIAGAFVFIRSDLGKRYFSTLFLYLPFVNNLTRQANSATVLRTISSLISAGVSMTQTLEITARVVQNGYYRKVLIEAYDKVQKGLPLSAVFAAHQNLFPIFASEMSAVGEETGKLPELLLKGALFFEDEVDQVTKNLSTVIEPVLMVFIGIAVGFFAISMIGPMYSLSNAIK
jgi:type IV pilus assembly protein PilC